MSPTAATTASAKVAGGTITTVAGGGPGCTEPCQATQQALNEPGAVAWRASGNLYIADTLNDRVRRVDVSSIIATVAGTPLPDFCGDGGPALGASCLDEPSDTATDSAGNLYIADRDNQRVRAINTQQVDIVITGITIKPGEIKTVAGGGPGCIEPCQATQQALSAPGGVAVDTAGSVYIADTGGNRIRKVDGAGNITTVAGGGPGCTEPCSATQQALSAPADIHVDSSSNLYIADAGSNRIRKVDGTGNITTVAGGGPGCTEPCSATQQALSAPGGVTLDGSGNLYIADSGNHRVRKVASATITTVAGGGTPSPGFCGDGGPASSACLNSPVSVAVAPGGHLKISDQGNHRVRAVTPGGYIYTIAGGGTPNPGFCGDGGPSTQACLSTPAGISYDDHDDFLYIADQANLRVRKLPPDSDMDGLLDRVEDTNLNRVYDPGADLSDLYTTDTDADGCADSEDIGLGFGPTSWYDFYDVPIPANSDPTPNGARNRAVNVQDLVGVLKYVGTADNGGSNGRVDYDSDKNGDGIEDGQDYDRSPGPLPNPPWNAGPPNGAVNVQDVVAVLRQAGLSCSGPP